MSILREFIEKPASKPDEREAESALMKQSSKPPESKAGQKKRILVLDDDPTFGELLMRYKNKYSVDIEFFENVHQFVQRLSEEAFDVVILDYYLEGYVGSQLTSLMPGIPIILTSNRNWQEHDSAMLPKGSRFLLKKLGPDTILKEALALASAKTSTAA